MNNPVKIYNDLLTVYLKYINSGLPFSRDEYNEERNALMREKGTISQPPIIEIVPRYKEHATLAQFCENEGVSKDINEFISAGLFGGGSLRSLYEHQYEALKESFINRKNIIVTTGTGSGKTECFLMPVIADLVNESRDWKQNRPRAVRTLILYPLNALAEDQMVRLRKALNSRRSGGNGSLDWLDKYRNGNRFYFGRYTGNTPVSGTRDKAASKLLEEKKSLIADWNAAKEALEHNGNEELIYHVPCMEPDSAEMWDRFSMQKSAPDILITNYSMLNIILMRDIENPIFESTKKWLQESPDHVFHLVIDELHTYRGTAGTEVAYLIRVLLDRLGLTPDSPQVQFLASSASMEEDVQTVDYLSEFFGVERARFSSSFRIISNHKIPAFPRPETILPYKLLEDYAQSPVAEADRDLTLFKGGDCSNFYAFTEKYELTEWLKYCLSVDGSIIARDIVKMSEKLDEGDYDRVSVISAILQIICRSKKNGQFIMPIRVHFFFRSVNGLWACSCKECTQIPAANRFPERYVGRFYKRPRTNCDCGNKVLELLVCENCGEVYLGGYLTKREGKTYITVEKPISEESCSHGVLWKRPKDGVPEGWICVDFNPFLGELKKDPDGTYCLRKQENEDTQYPSKCPQCEISYKVNDKNSITPIRRHSTGLQKVNQILADGLIRTMKNAGESNSKVVLFSDSRQAAAKLSAGIELDHFRDVLRWAMLNALKRNNRDVEFLKKIRSKKQTELSEDEIQEFKRLGQERLYRDITTYIGYEWNGWVDAEQTAKLNKYFNSTGGVRLDNIEDNVFNSMVGIGINPAGPKPSVNYNQCAGSWYELFDFNEGKAKSDLGDAKTEFLRNIRFANRNEQLASMFANKNKSFEDLKLGYLRPTAPASDSTFEEMLCSVIRILGSRRRVVGLRSKYPIGESFPQQAIDYVKKAYNIFSRKELKETMNKIKTELRDRHIIDATSVALTGEGLSFSRSEVGYKYWKCSVCGSVHMHHSAGVCVNCFATLDNPSFLTEKDLSDPSDYYLTLLNTTDKIYRLHCEELTGQTSKKDSRIRQRRFQDIFLENENPLVDGIDLLSVTTTMEAGVDIGSLSAVMLGNVPPQRFNYQQRVGRAGRRGNPLSIALTVARGTSHDITHFLETERMVSDAPRPPYLEVRTLEIAERIVNKEVLHQAFGGSCHESSDSVHGSFGKAVDWPKHKDDVSLWICSNDGKIRHIISTVTKGTSLTYEQTNELLSFVNNDLVKRITEIAESGDYTQDNLSERLANAGLLPMFGFPTRTRNLYLSSPNKLPWDDVVSRDVEMALNTFAPGHEIVKDKKVYKAVGVVDYEYNKSHIVSPKFNSLNNKKPLHRCLSCGFTTISAEGKDVKCPVCSDVMESVKICSPLGFCVDYNKPSVDFNGSFDWYSPNSDIKLDCEEVLVECPNVKNLVIKNNFTPSQGLVYMVNDNNGDLYRLGKNTAGIYVSRDAYSQEESETMKLDFETKYAFVASKTTGVLSLSLSRVDDRISLDPINNRSAVRAAFLSWGYLVRKSIASYLDIDSSELNVGYYVSKFTKKPGIFLVEKLDNGAGYCNYLCGKRYPEVPYKAIIEPLSEGGEIYNQLCTKKHIAECTSSCYDCIRDFSNQNLHNILDWRLGLDLARLAADPDAKIGLDVDYWCDFVNVTLNNILHLRGFSLQPEKGMLSGTNIDGKPCCVVHPLWKPSYCFENAGVKPGEIDIISAFDVPRLK